VNGEVRTREPIVQGIFYPDSGSELAKDVTRFLAESGEQFSIQPGATAVISPHAGYTFCGTFIGSAFLAAEGRKVDTVVLLAPVHREPEDAIYLTESKYFATPIGTIEVADEIVSELEACSTRIFRNDIPHLEEHAIEVQLPFIQHLYPDARIVPILMGRATETNVRLLAKALDLTFDENEETTLYVVSSNLTNHTEGDAAFESVTRLMGFIEDQDCEGLLSAYHKKDITACGSGCIATLLCMSRPRGVPKLLSKTPHGVDSNDLGRIIHYGAIAFYSSEGDKGQ
jgi:AmmeMemoRadiSam system protein B